MNTSSINHKRNQTTHPNLFGPLACPQPPPTKHKNVCDPMGPYQSSLMQVSENYHSEMAPAIDSKARSQEQKLFIIISIEPKPDKNK